MGSSKEDVTRAEEEFLLKLYGARTVQTLDKHRYTCYNRSIRRPSLSSSFKLESLPPTIAAAKQHSLRTYLTVQLNPVEWRWHLRENMMLPVETDQPVAPESILKLVSCGCKAGYGKTYGCLKLQLNCTAMCSQCEGQTCKSVATLSDEYKI